MDLNNEIVFDEQIDMGGSRIEPGIHKIKVAKESLVVGEDKNGPYKQVEIEFIFPAGSASVKEWYTISNGNPKAVNVGIRKLNGLLVAAGLEKISETNKSTDGIVGKTVVCNIIENEKGYLRIDDDYGKNYKPVTEKEKPVAVKEEKPSVSQEESDEIPF
jgi:hypothetical protein